MMSKKDKKEKQNIVNYKKDTTEIVEENQSFSEVMEKDIIETNEITEDKKFGKVISVNKGMIIVANNEGNGVTKFGSFDVKVGDIVEI